jgi:hypothetical protein
MCNRLRWGTMKLEATMLWAIFEGLSVWFVVSVAVGYAFGALIHHAERLRLQGLRRGRAWEFTTR